MESQIIYRSLGGNMFNILENTNTTICVGHYYMQTNANNVNKKTGGKDEPNIVLRGNRNST
jgi:hypothetical protein